MNINRGNRFDYLVSMSGSSRGLQMYAAEHFAEGDPRRGETFQLGDINVSLIRTIQGQTIYLVHDTLPTDMNVYDAAAWSAMVELTERSVANRSQAVDSPISPGAGGRPRLRSALSEA